MPDPIPLAEGTIVAGKLRVERLLGNGGMGAVYEVEHTFTRHRRALKLLHPEMAAHASVVARFLREASAAGHIGNAHIVETFDAGTLETGEPYLVMELLVGETLASRMGRSPRLGVAELVDVMRQACDGAHAAHTAGIVHRDLKPENLFLVAKDGKAFVKILDFGISKFDSALTGGHGTTKEGATLGTPFYMSPEQVNGEKDLDARTDVYALGVILFECASGRRPFVADALPKLAVLIHEGNPPRLADLRADLPPAFVDIVHKAMARDRNDRFATAKDLGAALEPFGGAMLEPTLPETTSIAPRAISETPSARSAPPPAPSDAPPPEARTPGKTMAGAAVSVAPVKKSRAVWLFAAAGVALLGAIGVAARTDRSPTAVGIAPSADAPLVSSKSALPLVPTAIATISEIVTFDASLAHTPVATRSASAGTPAVGRAPAASASAGAHETGTRVDQKGLASDNPFR